MDSKEGEGEEEDEWEERAQEEEVVVVVRSELVWRDWELRGMGWVGVTRQMLGGGDMWALPGIVGRGVRLLHEVGIEPQRAACRCTMYPCIMG